MGRIWKTGVTKERAGAVSWKSIGLINTAVVLEEASERHTKQAEATLFFFLLGFFFLFLPSSTHWSGSPVAFVLQRRYEEGISFQGTCLGLLELKAGNIKLQLQI